MQPKLLQAAGQLVVPQVTFSTDCAPQIIMQATRVTKAVFIRIINNMCYSETISQITKNKPYPWPNPHKLAAYQKILVPSLIFVNQQNIFDKFGQMRMQGFSSGLFWAVLSGQIYWFIIYYYIYFIFHLLIFSWFDKSDTLWLVFSLFSFIPD